jgi:hypothetical protein
VSGALPGAWRCTSAIFLAKAQKLDKSPVAVYTLLGDLNRGQTHDPNSARALCEEMGGRDRELECLLIRFLLGATRQREKQPQSLMERCSTQGHEKSNRGSFPLVRMTFVVGLECDVAKNFQGRFFDPATLRSG